MLNSNLAMMKMDKICLRLRRRGQVKNSQKWKRTQGKKKFSFFLTLFPPPNKRYVAHSFSTKPLSSTCSSSTRTPLYPPAANNNNKLVQFTRVVFLIVIVENLCVLVLHTRQKKYWITLFLLSQAGFAAAERGARYINRACVKIEKIIERKKLNTNWASFFSLLQTMEIYWNVFIPSEVLRIDFQLTGDEKKVCENDFVCIWIFPLTRVCWSSVKNSRWTSLNSSATRRPSTAAFP